MIRFRCTFLAFLIAAPVSLAGCGGYQLMPTPTLILISDSNPFERVPEVFRSTELDILFATDRAPLSEEESEGKLIYGNERSRSLAFGSCRVRIGDENLTWEQLVAESRTENRTHDLEMTVTETRELVRAPETPYALVKTANGVEIAPEVAMQRSRAAERLRTEIRDRLAKTSRKELYIYIHGVATSFEKAAFTVAEVWHFAGRGGVPIAYSWPASGNYNYDRESGEFTVFHLKQFLLAVSAMPEVEHIHLIAHSRGTDVTLTALRELNIEVRAAKAEIGKRLKINNVILCAPDLDFEVVQQRIAAERMQDVMNRLTVYLSRDDLAIGAATWLFGSQRRVGRLRPEDIPDDMTERIKLVRSGAFVDADIDSGLIGHSYFHTSPAVSSDLLLVLLHDRDPGAENGRPLEPVAAGYWRLTDDYLIPEND